jgi:hypothetical protein
MLVRDISARSLIPKNIGWRGIRAYGDAIGSIVKDRTFFTTDHACTLASSRERPQIRSVFAFPRLSMPLACNSFNIPIIKCLCKKLNRLRWFLNGTLCAESEALLPVPSCAAHDRTVWGDLQAGGALQ